MHTKLLNAWVATTKFLGSDASIRACSLTKHCSVLSRVIVRCRRGYSIRKIWHWHADISWCVNILVTQAGYWQNALHQLEYCAIGPSSRTVGTDGGLFLQIFIMCCKTEWFRPKSVGDNRAIKSHVISKHDLQNLLRFTFPFLAAFQIIDCVSRHIKGHYFCGKESIVISELALLVSRSLTAGILKWRVWTPLGAWMF